MAASKMVIQSRSTSAQGSGVVLSRLDKILFKYIYIIYNPD